LKAEALYRTLWKARFGRGYGPVLSQTTEWMNEWMNEWIRKGIKVASRVNLLLVRSMMLSIDWTERRQIVVAFGCLPSTTSVQYCILVGLLCNWTLAAEFCRH
jgi:hypothetical protein